MYVRPSIKTVYIVLRFMKRDHIIFLLPTASALDDNVIIPVFLFVLCHSAVWWVWLV